MTTSSQRSRYTFHEDNKYLYLNSIRFKSTLVAYSAHFLGSNRICGYYYMEDVVAHQKDLQ
jgi:hypothetical protein